MNAFKDNTIYLKHKNDFSIRLLSFEEATEVYLYLREIYVSEVFPLWTDDNSNYIGVYIVIGPTYQAEFVFSRP